MPPSPRPLGPFGLILLSLVGLSGCVYLFRTVDTEEIDPGRPPTTVEAPVKAHLQDGSVALFRTGATFTTDSIYGNAWQYGLNLNDSTRVTGLPLDSVAALETYRREYRTAESLVVSALASSATVVGTVGMAKALFGSCPTVYSKTDSLTLEAETFSNSIVPLFEMRDVNALSTQADSSGALTLEIRNEALETHYINHLELVEAPHAPTETALPTGDGRAWILGDLRTPEMSDKWGRDQTDVLSAADGRAYRTPEAALRAVDSTQLTEHIDVVLPAPVSDTAVVTLRLRNSLLNTLLLYDYMLADQGAEALNWLGNEMEVISTALELSDFYRRRMGLRVHRIAGGTPRQVGRVSNVGPIAWSREAVAVPVPPDADSLRLRLSFLPDAWRIDEVAVAHETRRIDPNRHELAAVRTPGHAPETALADLRAPDHSYWVTRPTDRFWATFEPGSAPDSMARTFFLAAQGYYTEWMRRSWLEGPPRTSSTGPFTLTDQDLVNAIQEWATRRPDFEAQFRASKLPVH